MYLEPAQSASVGSRFGRFGRALSIEVHWTVVVPAQSLDGFLDRDVKRE
jgi:hypothetical protein